MWTFLSLILLATAFLIVHFVVVWQALSASKMQWKYRLIALLPPAAPIVAWKADRRFAPMLWAVLLLAYAVLRLMA